MKTKLTVLQDTLLKPSSFQSSEQSPDDLVEVHKGDTFEPIDIHQEAGHIRLTLAEGLGNPPLDTWYLFAEHVQVEEDEADRQPEKLAITNLNRDKKNRGPLLALPGLSGAHMFDPVSEKSPNFFWYELTRNGERMPEHEGVTQGMIRIAELAQQARDKAGEAFIITSGYRPPAINRAIGGAINSRHIEGDALDGYFVSMNKWEMWDFFAPWWPGGLGIYGHNDIIHIDARGYRARWGG